MTAQQESLPRTLGVAAAVAVVCSLLVSGVVYFLRPFELAYSEIERNRAVLEALGMVQSDDDLSEAELVDIFVTLQRFVIDVESGEFTSDVDRLSYDYRAAAEQGLYQVQIPSAEDVGGLGSRGQYMPIYVLSEAGRLQRIVLPIHARGMWSDIYGFVALESDLQTIAGVSIYEHGETPGIGDRILDPQWLGRWHGKQLYGPDRDLRFRIASGSGASEAAYTVDSITGATVTVIALSDAMRYWFSEHGYGRFLEKLAEDGL